VEKRSSGVHSTQSSGKAEGAMKVKTFILHEPEDLPEASAFISAWKRREP
jgi:hypothetical protein